MDEKYLEKIEKIEFQPIFILGMHRSGTTILYKMLSDTGYFNTLTAYHVIYYDQLLKNYMESLESKKKNELNNELLKKGIATRKTDNVKVDANYEHEYVYILQNKNKSPSINEDNKKLMIEICKKIKFISNNNKPILLKNPYDFGNFLFIKKVFPNAKFVFIHRNPKYVLSSTTRLWKTHFSRKNEFLAMYSKRYKTIYSNPLSRLLFKLMFTSKIPIGIFDSIKLDKKNTSKYIENIENLSKKDFISIKYEDLIEKPNKTMKNVLEFLNFEKNKDFKAYIKPRKLSLTSEVKFLNNFIFNTFRGYFEYLGYEK